MHNKNTIIEINLFDYNNVLFNAIDTINNSIKTIHPNSTSHICISCFGKSLPKSYEEKVKYSIRNYYHLLLANEIKYIKSMYKKIILYSIISFIVIFIKMMFSSLNIHNILYNTLCEIINIGGWVFLWEAVSLYFFNSNTHKDNIKIYKNILHSNISFIYY